MEKRKRRKFTAEYKAEVVGLVQASGKGIGQVAREMDLTETAVRAWVKQLRIDGKPEPLGPLTSEERAELTGCGASSRRCRRSGTSSEKLQPSCQERKMSFELIEEERRTSRRR